MARTGARRKQRRAQLGTRGVENLHRSGVRGKGNLGKQLVVPPAAGERANDSASAAASSAAGPLSWARSHAFALALTLALVATVVPLWCSRYLPMVDLPQHLLTMHIAGRLDESSLPYGDFFMNRPGFTPYLAYYSVVRAMSVVLPLEAANRVFLSVCAAGLPLATLWLLQALGRNRWLALLACPLAYDFSFKYGFTSQAAGVVLMVASLAAFVTRLRGRASSMWWDVPLVLLPMACVTAHALPFFLFLGALVVMCATFRAHALPTLVRTLPALGLFSTWAIPAAERAHVIGRLETHPLLEHIRQFPEFVFAWFQGPGGYVASVSFLCLCSWAAALCRRERRRAAALPANRVMLVLFVVVALGYLFVPWDLERILIVYPRLASLVCLVGLVALPLPAGRLPRSFRLAVIGFVIGFSAYLTLQFQRVDRTFGDLEDLAARMDRRTCIAAFRKYFPNPLLRGTAAHSHDAEYLALFTDSLPGYTFAYTPQSPLALRRPDGSLASGVEDARLPVVRGSTRQAEFADFYRYFLVPAHEAPRSVFGPYAASIRAVAQSGPYVLYENPRGTCGR